MKHRIYLKPLYSKETAHTHTRMHASMHTHTHTHTPGIDTKAHTPVTNTFLSSRYKFITLSCLLVWLCQIPEILTTLPSHLVKDLHQSMCVHILLICAGIGTLLKYTIHMCQHWEQVGYYPSQVNFYMTVRCEQNTLFPLVNKIGCCSN